jgi:hypothetical protein
VQFSPTPVNGGSAPCLCLYNPYNPVPVESAEGDASVTPNFFWTYGTATWRAADNSSSNKISILDGLGQARVQTDYSDNLMNASGATVNGYIGIDRDSCSASPTYSAFFYSASTSITSSQIIARGAFGPAIGLHYYCAVEYVATGSQRFYGSATGFNMRLAVRLPD